MATTLSGVDFFQVDLSVLQLTGEQSQISVGNLDIAMRRPSGDFRVLGNGSVRNVDLTNSDSDEVLNVGETFTVTSTTTNYTLGRPGTPVTEQHDLTVIGSGTFGTLLGGTHNVIVATDAEGQAFLTFPDGDMPSGLIGNLDQTLLTTLVLDDVGYDLQAGAPLCFARGTLLDTPQGPRAIEHLRPGDLVITKDHGPRPIRWIGNRVISGATLARHENLRPILIRAGALGQNMPARDLIVSPQHRILLRSRVAQKIFGAREVLVAAKQLLQIDGIDICRDIEAGIDYFHMLFDQHEVVFANGAETESLYTGPQALKSVGQAALDEIFAIFPELQDADHQADGARVLASGRQGRKLVARHYANRQPLVS